MNHQLRQGGSYYVDSPPSSRLRAFLALVAVTTLWIVVGGIMIGVVGLVVDISLGVGSLEQLLDGEPWVSPVSYAAQNLGLAFLVPSCYFAYKWLMHRSPTALFSVSPLPQAGFFWATLGVAMIGYGALQTWRFFDEGYPGSLTITFGHYMLAMVLTVPLQAMGEEVAFRGLIPKALASLVGSRHRLAEVVGILGSSAAFVLIHGATNLWLNIYYLILGVGLCAVVRATGSLWPAIAIHTANNLCALTLAFYWDGAEGLYDRGEGVASPAMLAPVAATFIALCFAAVLIHDKMMDRHAHNRSAAGADPLALPDTLKES